jgi:serine/threonine protein kinase
MDTSNDSLLCPLTLDLFRDPVVAQDGHTYERNAIEEWIRKNGTSPLTRQPLSIQHLIPNITVKKIVDSFETSTRNKNYQFILDVDVKKKKGRPLFQATGKAIYHAEWLPTNNNQPEIVLLKIDGTRAKKEAGFYVELSRHSHILRTFGFVGENDNISDSNAVMLLQEYAPAGSLYEMLDDRRTVPNEHILIEIFLQIIDAMTFLAYNHVVHGDLACRNVLVFRFDENDPKKIVVKVTDFGLSRYSKLYSVAPGSARTTLNIIPIRYAAPEVLSVTATSDDYTEKSDVFSMGVLMWEAYSRGKLPWPEIERDEEVVRRVINGDLLSKPPNCSQRYWSIIIKTWAKSPNDRPTFIELKRLLTEQNYQSGNYFMFVINFS